MCQALRRTGKGELSKQDQLCVEIAGLCHDLGKYRIVQNIVSYDFSLRFFCPGHGPFSHLWEVFVRSVNPKCGWTHEQSSLDMLDMIVKSEEFYFLYSVLISHFQIMI